MHDHQDNKNKYQIYQNNKLYIQVPPNRRSEIEQFLKLFGYNSEKTILQVHLIGFFRKKN